MKNRAVFICLFINAILWILLISGNLRINTSDKILTAKYLRIIGGEDHCFTDKGVKAGIYENEITGDLLVNDIRSWGSVYGWYGGFDGTLYMRGQEHHVRPLTLEENEQLHKREYISNYAVDDKGTISGFNWKEQRYEFKIDGKLIVYIDERGIHSYEFK